MTPDENELYEWARAAMPDWYADDDRPNEFLGSAAVVMAKAKGVVADWITRQTRITEADGPTDTLPDFLGAHARDRGSQRQDGEGNDALRARLRSPADDAVTPAGLQNMIRAMLAAGNIDGDPVIIELPRDAARLGTWEGESGTGGTFADLGGGMMAFTPTARFRGNVHPPAFPAAPRSLTLTGAGYGGNDGTFPVEGALDDGAVYAHPGQAGADPGVHWSLVHLDRQGNTRDGFAAAFASRGYRVAGIRPMIIVILPYPTGASLAASITEAVRVKKAAGVISVIERRATP